MPLPKPRFQARLDPDRNRPAVPGGSRISMAQVSPRRKGQDRHRERFSEAILSILPDRLELGLEIGHESIWLYRDDRGETG